MRALVYEAAWRMPLREVKLPEPGPGEVVVKVAAVGICGSDVHGFTGSTGRRIAPVVMGHEFSGTVAAVGAGVTGHAAGDRVVVQPLLTCGTCVNCRAGLPNICLNRRGIGMMDVDGAYAEAVAVPQQLLYALPEGLSWEQGAMVEPLAVALRAANQTPITLGDTVVVIGAGPIGLLAMLAARLKGAGQVIMTDLSPHRLEMARRLGADLTINPREQDALAVVREQTGGTGAHATIEAVGIGPTVEQSLALVRTGGHVTWIGNSAPRVELNMQEVVTRELTIRGTYGFAEEFPRAIDTLRSGRIDVTPLIERVAPLEDGPTIVHDLAEGSLDIVKVILKP
jgi:L-iditol 2-dehydrogenase